MKKKRPKVGNRIHSCDREIRADRWAMSGHRQDGDKWKCSCKRTYVHVCDEAEGCFWTRETIRPRARRGEKAGK